MTIKVSIDANEVLLGFEQIELRAPARIDPESAYSGIAMRQNICGMVSVTAP